MNTYKSLKDRRNDTTGNQPKTEEKVEEKSPLLDSVEETKEIPKETPTPESTNKVPTESKSTGTSDLPKTNSGESK